MSRSIKLALGLIVALPALAQAQAIGPGFELERSGRYADAASIYFTTVRSDPTNIPALLGLERTLFVLNRMSELLPLVQNACARQPDSPALRSLANGASRSPIAACGMRHGARSSLAGGRSAATARSRSSWQSSSSAWETG